MRTTFRNPVVLGGLGAVAAGAWYLWAPGRSASTAVADLGALLTGSISLTPDQRNMAAVISAEFGSQGFGWLANAAIANAYAESRLDPNAVGDNGHAVGLFQLNDAVSSAAGYGMTTEDRKNPVINTRRILEVVRSSDGASIRAAHGTASHSQLASLFAQWAERCGACGWNGGSAELVSRAALVGKLFGPTIAQTVP